MTTAKPTESQQLDRLSHDLGIQFAYPNSDKIYLSGSRADMRVPLRQIRQDDTVSAQGREPNPPIPVYDTSGPYGDPNAEIDLKQGLADVRGTWIAERGDTEQFWPDYRANTAKRARTTRKQRICASTKSPARCAPKAAKT